MPFDFISNFFKGKKNDKKAEEAPVAAEAAEPAKEEAAPDLQLGYITASQINEQLAKLNRPEQTLRQVMDEMSFRLISRGTDPHLTIGEQLQRLREEMTSDESPFMDFDTALISAVEQMEHFCDAPNAELARNSAAKMIDLIFEGRKGGTPSTQREVFQLKGYYLKAQLISQQGQLLESQATIDRYRKQLARFEANSALDPTGMQTSQIKLILEHSEQMKSQLLGNISALQTSIIGAESQMNQAELQSIDPKAALESTVEMINKQRQVYLGYLRQLSDANEVLKLINEGAMEIKVQERVTMQRLHETQRQIEMDQVLRQKREAYAAYDPAKKTSPVAAAPVENKPAPSVVEAEEVAPEAPMNFLDF